MTTDDKDMATKCMHSAVNYLSRREHSIVELAQKLSAKSFDNDIVQQTLERLIEKDYLSNLRYAEMLIRTRQQQGYGKRYIEQELTKQGVESTIWHQVDVDINNDRAWADAFEVALAKKCHQNTVYVSSKRLKNSQKPKHSSQYNRHDDSSKENTHHAIVNKEKTKIMAYLTRRGFSFEVINQALHSINFVVVED